MAARWHPARHMAHVITDAGTKDEWCVEACPSDSIHPRKDEASFEEAPRLFVNPAECIAGRAYVPVCPTGAIVPQKELPAESAHFADLTPRAETDPTVAQAPGRQKCSRHAILAGFTLTSLRSTAWARLGLG